MKCLICAKTELVRDTRDISYTYKGETAVLPNVTGDFCPACGESIHNAEESTRVSAFMLEFNKQVNAAIIDPGFISSVRKKFALDQADATRRSQSHSPFHALSSSSGSSSKSAGISKPS